MGRRCATLTSPGTLRKIVLTVCAGYDVPLRVRTRADTRGQAAFTLLVTETTKREASVTGIKIAVLEHGGPQALTPCQGRHLQGSRLERKERHGWQRAADFFPIKYA